jgi:hypothetical protein
MNDTSPEIAKRLRNAYLARSDEERMLMGSRSFAACGIQTPLV